MRKHACARDSAPMSYSGAGLLFFALTLFSCVMMLMPPVVAAAGALMQRWTPLEKTSAVTLSAGLVAQLREAGIRELRPLPAWSGAAGVFVMHVNGEEPPQRAYSEVGYASWLYRLSLTDAGADVFVRKDGKEALTPAEYRILIERDAERYLRSLAAQQKQAAQLAAWD